MNAVRHEIEHTGVTCPLNKRMCEKEQGEMT